MKKVYTLIKNSTEQKIIALTASAVLAIVFDGKKKKPEKRKSFLVRMDNHYNTINDLLAMSCARKLKKDTKEKLRQENRCNGELKSKLKDLEITKADIIDL